jgi:DNA-binding NarL/FixJ family response regulator
VDSIAAGEIFLGQSVAQKLALSKLRPADRPSVGLTSRDTEVLSLLGHGKSISEIATELGISYRTAAAVCANIRNKLDLPTMPALVKYAVERLERS